MRGEEVRRNPALFHSADTGQVKQRTQGHQQRNKARKTKPVIREAMRSESLATPTNLFLLPMLFPHPVDEGLCPTPAGPIGESQPHSPL